MDPDPHQRNQVIFTKKIVSELSEIWSGMFIPDPDLDFLPHPGSGSATLDQSIHSNSVVDQDPERQGRPTKKKKYINFMFLRVTVDGRYGLGAFSSSWPMGHTLEVLQEKSVR